MLYNETMIYLIYGYQLPVIRKTLKNLIRTCLNGEEQNDFNVEKLSARLVPVQDIVFSALSLPLGSSHKVLVVTEPYFLSEEKEKISFEKDQDYKALIQYLNEPSPHTDLIFFLESRTVDTKSEVYKAVKAKGKLLAQEVLTEDMLKAMGTAIFTKKGAQISRDALEELARRCGDDVSKFVSEATKLSLYKNDITVDDVVLMVAAKPEENAFAIADALLQKKTSAALKTYYDLRINKEEPVRLILLLAAQFRFMMEVQYLLSKNTSFDRIAAELKAKPFRVNKTARTLASISKAELMNVEDALYEMDFQIKSGLKDPYMTFELFLLNFETIRNGKFKV